MRLMVAAVALVVGGSVLVAPGDARAAERPAVVGTAVAWGDNYFGELGDGTKQSRPYPTAVRGLPTGIVQLAGGVRHTLALRNDGTVWAWGYNFDGQLGDGTREERLQPVPVQGLSGVDIVQVAAGSSHSVALDRSGSVWTWGENFSGELGDGARTPRYFAAPVGGLNEVVQIVADGYHTLALRSDGTVWGWGGNLDGQLGTGGVGFEINPVRVPGLPFITQLSTGGHHSMALSVDKRVYAWGLNRIYGQLGDGTTQDRLAPVPVQGLDRVKQIAAGGTFSAALREDGTVYTWGENRRGALGNGTTDDAPHPVPARVPGLSGVTGVVAGGVHAMVTRPGQVLGWGLNQVGQLGDGTNTPTVRPTPTLNRHLTGVVQLTAGNIYSVALVTAPQGFSLSVSQTSGTVRAGGSTTTTVSVVPLNGFDPERPVALTVTGLPFGITASFTPTTVATGKPSVMTVTSSPVALADSRTLTITGTASGLTPRSTGYGLAVIDGSEFGCTNTNDVDTAIPDNGSAVLSVMPLFGCDTATAPTSAVVEVHITHPRRGDLVIDLISPDGTAHPLKAGNPTDGGVDVHETFVVDLTEGAAAAVAGKIPGGGWVLSVRDVATGSVGLLDRWTLAI